MIAALSETLGDIGRHWETLTWGAKGEQKGSTKKNMGYKYL